MTVTPRGLQDVTPAAAVVSFIAPTKPFDFDVIERFWHRVCTSRHVRQSIAG